MRHAHTGVGVEIRIFIAAKTSRLSRPHGRGSRNRKVCHMIQHHIRHAHTGVGVEIYGFNPRTADASSRPHGRGSRNCRDEGALVDDVSESHAHTGVGVEMIWLSMLSTACRSRPHGRGSRNHMSFCRPSAPARHAHTGVGE